MKTLPMKPEAAAARLMKLITEHKYENENFASVGAVNGAFTKGGATIADYSAGRDHALAQGLIKMHDSGSRFMIVQAVE